VPSPDPQERQRRDGQLAQLAMRGIPPRTIWLRFLTAEGLQPDELALWTIAGRYGGEPDTVLDAWIVELAEAIEVATTVSSRDEEPGEDVETLVSDREGPRLALLHVPRAAFATALAPFARQLPGARRTRFSLRSAGRRCRPGHRTG
jgi:hypothetical protein